MCARSSILLALAVAAASALPAARASTTFSPGTSSGCSLSVSSTAKPEFVAVAQAVATDAGLFACSLEALDDTALRREARALNNGFAEALGEAIGETNAACYASGTYSGTINGMTLAENDATLIADEFDKAVATVDACLSCPTFAAELSKKFRKRIVRAAGTAQADIATVPADPALTDLEQFVALFDPEFRAFRRTLRNLRGDLTKTCGAIP